ncbi:MAG: FtsW/RodA/SpoVE family cell cycle protein [Wolbachia endosymbiont of Fragariocoptes setiger]|nr:FtsW/RodA/SpoVE family cell cycle protein [Wolbachia endosymbiont of Fragariocoptes setiger]
MNIKQWYKTLDYYLIFPVFLLLTIGFILVYSSSPIIAQRLFLPQDHFIKRHMIYMILSVITILIFSSLSIRSIYVLSIVSLVFFVILMFITITTGTELNGARRWINILHISLQPSEFVKPFFSIVTASILSSKMQFKVHISIAIFLLVFVMLILQPDFGMSMLLTYSWVSQIFVACIPLLYFLCIGGIVLISIVVAYFYLPHVKQRVCNFLFFSQHDNFQVTKSLEAFKRGGLTGVGPGEGNIKMFLPDCHTDFIFSVLAEEYGIITCLVTLMLFGIIAIRLFYILYKENELSHLLAVVGISFLFIAQFIINIGVTLNIFPTTGMTLPLLSYGGSSLLSSSIVLGIMLSFSRNLSIKRNFHKCITPSAY